MTEETKASVTFADLPKLKDQLDGGTFAGVITLADGRHCAVVLLKDRPENRLTWENAIDWARSVGGQLATPAVALLLQVNCPDLLPQTWVWTDKPEGSSYAWSCHFSEGYVGCITRFADGGAVAVRLIPIIT